jgi:Tol biopolymer transport system component
MLAVMAPSRGARWGLLAALIMAACGQAGAPPHGCGLEGTTALPETAPQLAYTCSPEPSSHFHQDIFIVRPGEPARLVTHGEGGNFLPRWSPDGRRIAFGSTRTGYMELYVMNADGSGVDQITHLRGFINGIGWSPDGTEIAFASSAAGLTGPLGVLHSPSDIYIARADGTGARRLTFDGGGNSQPVWSPDGRRILFTSDLGGPYQVWAMSSDGSGQRPLTSVSQNGSPDWSPDGSQIVFNSERDYPGGYAGAVYLMAADGSAQRRLVDGGVRPNWSRDGKWIAFEKGSGEGIEIYAIHPNGSGLTRLTSDGANKWDPAWAPW